VVHLDGPGEVGEEDERALEDRDEDEIAPGVVPRDLRPELLDPGKDLPLGKIDLSETRIRR
jgi:hypothetical protein